MKSKVGYDRFGRAQVGIRGTYSLTQALSFYRIEPDLETEEVDTNAGSHTVNPNIAMVTGFSCHQLGTEVLGGGANFIGTPDELRGALRTFQEAGVDQTIFIQQGGKNRHDHICESLELFAAEVMPEFAEREADRERAKRQELAPYVEAALARKQAMPSPADSEIAVYEAYGNTVALTDDDIQKLPEGNRRRVLTFRRIREIAERAARGD